MQPDVLEAIRELHKPDGDLFPSCRGCDADGWEVEDPSWPCRTAALVYSEQEIADVKALSERCQAEARERRSTEERSAISRLIPAVWQEQIAKQIQGTEWIGRFNALPEHNGTFSVPIVRGGSDAS